MMVIVTVPPAWIDATWEHQLRRLRALDVLAIALDAPSSRALFRRFVDEFGDPARGADLLVAAPERIVHFEQWLRPECMQPSRAEGSLRWLAAGREDVRCVRFEPRRRLPALAIDLGTLEDGWAASWPGAFVNFERARAFVVSVDYEAFRCDLRGRGDTPYR